MEKELKDNFWSSIVSGKTLSSLLSQKKSTYVFENILPESLERYKNEGWEIEKRLKNKIKVKKSKKTDVLFEDEVWTTFANLGFIMMNKDRRFLMPYSDDLKLTQQIDVFAADSETILFIECKSCEEGYKKGNFKETIEAIGGKKEGFFKAIRSLFPGNKHKVKFILATKNYIISEQDKERLDNFGILHFNEETIEYYQELTKHLGAIARFQLLGNLFEGQEIPEIQNKVPAIEAKMGGHVYYSFSIEPVKLLKIGYVLHRNKANKKLMPTYQRLMKKTRLKSIQEFINNGGFFPNSIIININTDGKKLRFDKASNQLDDSISKIGILHLPKQYRSAFVIDGQHRLYGYANSEYVKTNSIPVVAFINLDRNDQVRLFMQINENQKAVPKNLRNTLNSDLLWDSDDLNEKIKALKLAIAQELGEDKSSPLFDRIIVGENIKSSKRCITIDTVRLGLDRSNFFGQFSKNVIKENGTFYNGNNDSTFDLLFPFLKNCLNYVKNGCLAEWELGDSEGGFLAINAGVESLIRIFSDIIDLLVSNNTANPKKDSTDYILKLSYPYLDPLIKYINQLTAAQKSELRKSYGTGGRVKYLRTLQKAIFEVKQDFNPKGLSKYWSDEAKTYNEESFKIIRDLETFFKKDFRIKLQNHFGESWFKSGVPKSVYDESIKRAADKNYEIDNEMDEVTPWDCLNIIDYRKIATHAKNWIEIFEKDYTKPGEEKISGGKEAKTSWMQKLEKIRNQNFHSYSVKTDEYQLLCELYEWLIERRIEAEFE